VLKGAFDKFAESTKAKRGTAEFDADFLATIEGWRLDLARNLALRNPKLTQRELNFAVQRIIDRIIFLRICEARGIEDHGRLQALVNGDRIYPRLAELFQAADVRYNSGLFHFQPEPGRLEPPDELTLAVEIDDKLLTRQIGRYPEFAIDTAGWHCLNTMFMVNLRAAMPDPLYVLGVLNSKLIRALWLHRFYDQRRTFPKIKGTYLKQLPIPCLDHSDPADTSRHERMVQLVEQMLELNRRLPSVRTPQEKTALERQIAATDTQIDRLVYDLYGLTEEEIRIVEGAQRVVGVGQSLTQPPA